MIAPRRLPAKSMRELPEQRSITGRKVPPQFQFSRVRTWEYFNEFTQKNLSRVRHPQLTARTLEISDMALVFIAPVLRQNNIEATFLTGPNDSFIGSADMIMKINLEIALIGQVCNLSADKLQQPPSDPCIWAPLHELACTMLANDVAFGLLTNNAVTRFVRLCPPSSDPRVRDLEIVVTPPVFAPDLEQSFLAVSLEGFYGKSRLNYRHGFEIVQELVEMPDVVPLCSHESVLRGQPKWWATSRSIQHEIRVHIDTASKVGKGFTGSLIETNVVHPALLLISRDEGPIRLEASMYEYLGAKSLKCVPKCILYGHFLGQFHIIALEPCGKPLQVSDLNDDRVVDAAENALASLHDANVMHRSISIESFYIDTDKTVRIADFKRAKLYKRVPEIARQEEMQQLRDILDAARKI